MQNEGEWEAVRLLSTAARLVRREVDNRLRELGLTQERVTVLRVLAGDGPMKRAELARRLRGFDDPDAVLTAPETRSSAPLRMLRNQRRESPIGGLYPLGEGAGHAGGIVSAAVDGLLAGLEE